MQFQPKLTQNHQFPMQKNTISVSPIPLSTTTQKIRQVFHAFSVKNVRIDGDKAFVEFKDEDDLQTLDFQFNNHEVAQLNNAKIELVEFDWSNAKNDNILSVINSSSSSEHQDLMAVDIDNLIVIEKCQQNILKSFSVDNIKNIFKDFQSVHRVVKRKNDVIIQFTDLGDLEKLQIEFHNLKVPQLGSFAQIEKASPQKITPEEFVSQWSRSQQLNTNSIASDIGYENQTNTSQIQNPISKLGYAPTEQKTFHSVLHQDIIPPFDKKTSMEVNFLNEQSTLGYKDEKKHETIPQATTHQQLDITLQENKYKPKLGYEYVESLKRKQEKQAHQKLEQQRKKQEERLLKERQDKKRKQEEIIRKQQEQKQRQQEADLRKKKQQQERLKKTQQEQQNKRLIEIQRQMQRKKQQQALKLIDLQEKKPKHEENISKQLKEKFDQQKKKLTIKQNGFVPQKVEERQIPTQSENIGKQLEAVKEAEKSIEKKIGYAFEKTKQQVKHLLDTGLNLLTGEKAGKRIQQKGEQEGEKKLRYQYKSPKQIGLNLVGSVLQFLNRSKQKFQQHFGKQICQSSERQTYERKEFSKIGYDKWSVKPDVNVSKTTSVKGGSKVLKSLITVTLLIWVIFLLMQDTSDVIPNSEDIQIPIASD